MPQFPIVRWLLSAALLLAAAPAAAQMSLLPPACANLNGEALDKCLRDIAAPVIVPKLEALEPPPPDPAAPANCTQVLAADRDFCVWRNEIVLACRNRAKYPDFNACFAQYIPNVAKPGVANCAREQASQRTFCAARNTVYAKCLEEPLGYFLCLATQAKPAAPAAKP